MNGWISLYRKIQDNWIWERDDYFKAWVDILFMVNHKSKKILLDGNFVKVERGERYTSLRKLSNKWNWSTTKVNRFLKIHNKDGMIELKKDTKNTDIKVCNYNVYKDNLNEEKTDKKQIKNSKKTGKKQSDNSKKTEKKTNNNVNNDNNENNENKITYRDVLDFYDELENLPGYNKITDKRKSHIKARLKNYSMDEIKEVLKKASNSKFLNDNLGSSSNWYDFDWIWNPNNFIKIHEGKYNKNNNNKKPINGRFGVKKANVL